MKIRSLLGSLLILSVAGCANPSSSSSVTPTSVPVEKQNETDIPDEKQGSVTPNTVSQSLPDAGAPVGTFSRLNDDVIAQSETKPIQPASVETSEADAKSLAADKSVPKTEDKRVTNVTTPVDGEHGEPLDLTAYYGTPASAFDKIQKYPWRDAPRGAQILGNISVEIGGMICLWGAANAEGGLVFPEFIEGIKVDRRFESLYLLHATFHNTPAGTSVSHLIFNYEDESFDHFEILCGNHVKDWLPNPQETLELGDPNSKVVFRNKSSMHPETAPREVRFFITEIPNKKPGELVTTIDLASSKERSASCILGMTTGPASLLKVDP